MDYAYTRDQLPSDQWDIDHPDRVDAQGNKLRLCKEVEAAFPDLEFRVECIGATVTVIFADVELTAEQEATLDQVVADHKANTTTAEMLDALKTTKVLELSAQVEAYITDEERYPIRRQITLQKLQSDADRDGLTNRSAYIQQGWDFAFQVMGYYYGVEAAVMAAANKAEIDAIILNMAQFNSHERVTILGAMAITD